jgi:hypothetical protein
MDNNINQPRGILLRKKPYVISQDGIRGKKVHINEMSGFEIGDKVFQIRRDDGILMLVPEDIYNES